jgi:hypothetical protein
MGARLVPLDGVCLGRTLPREHVLALIRAEQLLAPEGDDALVPLDYLSELDPDPVHDLAPGMWRDHLTRELRRFRDGRTRLLEAASPDQARRREQQLMRIGSAAWGIGLVLAMAQHEGDAGIWFDRAATFYRRSLADAEPGSWGRSIGALKARLLGSDPAGARVEARWTLQLGAATSPSPTARYAASLSSLVLGHTREAERLAGSLGDGFPPATAAALRAIATDDGEGFRGSTEAVLETFETRERFLEDIPVADTVLTLLPLARARGIDVRLHSPMLPEGS